MTQHRVLFLVSTHTEKQYLLESLRGLAGVVPYGYKIVQHSVGKASAAYDAALELSASTYSLVVSAGYGRSLNRNVPRGALITPSEIIDIELAQRARILPEAGIAYRFDCLCAHPGTTILCSDRWLCTEEHYQDVYALVGPTLLETAALDTECAALAQAAEDAGCPFTVAKILAAGATCSTEADVDAYIGAPDYLRNFDPIVHYVADVLKRL